MRILRGYDVILGGLSDRCDIIVLRRILKYYSIYVDVV